MATTDQLSFGNVFNTPHTPDMARFSDAQRRDWAEAALAADARSQQTYARSLEVLPVIECLKEELAFLENLRRRQDDDDIPSVSTTTTDMTLEKGDRQILSHQTKILDRYGQRAASASAGPFASRTRHAATTAWRRDPAPPADDIPEPLSRAARHASVISGSDADAHAAPPRTWTPRPPMTPVPVPGRYEELHASHQRVAAEYQRHADAVVRLDAELQQIQLAMLSFANMNQ